MNAQSFALSATLILFANFAFAQDTQLFEKIAGNEVALEWDTETKLGMFKNRSKIPFKGHVVTITVPKDLEVRKIRSKNKNKLALNRKTNQFIVRMESETDLLSVFFKGAKKKLVVIKSKPEDSGVHNNNCKELDFFLAEKDSGQNTPFRIDMTCYKKNKKDYMVITTPKEALFSSSTVPENRGKGEHWKEYRVDQIPTGEVNVRGTLSFLYGEKYYNFELRVVQKVEKQDALLLKQYYILGYGTLSLAVTTELSDKNESPSAIIAGVEAPLPIRPLRFGVSFLLGQSAEVAEGEDQPLEFTETRLHVAYDFAIGEKSAVYPLLAGVFFDVSDPNFRFEVSHQQLGAGLGFYSQFTDSFFFQLDALTSGMMAATPTSHVEIQGRLIWQAFDKVGFGLQFGSQTFSTESTAGTTNESSNSHTAVFLKL